MKFYESHYEEYLHALDDYNIHPEMKEVHDNIPKNFQDMGNLIVYGPSGVGKYSQVLQIIRKFSNTNLKYDKKIKIQTDKQAYIYHISDIHYEIDLSLLGCNSKMMWHEIFMQIIDIISVKADKKGIILCKNFHSIHSELQDIFYSYIQQHNIPPVKLNNKDSTDKNYTGSSLNNTQSNIQIRFIILTEHVSFIPNNILNCCKIISIARPSKENYAKLASHTKMPSSNDSSIFTQRITKPKALYVPNCENNTLIDNIQPENIMNCKEVLSFSLIQQTDQIPQDIFNIICNNVINEMDNYNKIQFTTFRDTIYDILIYNLDFTECLWYIFTHFVKKGALSPNAVSEVLKKTHKFLKYYNNNYRPIYHLESILFYIINNMYHT